MRSLFRHSYTNLEKIFLTAIFLNFSLLFNLIHLISLSPIIDPYFDFLNLLFTSLFKLTLHQYVLKKSPKIEILGYFFKF